MPKISDHEIQTKTPNIYGLAIIKSAFKKIGASLNQRKYRNFAQKYFHWKTNPYSNERQLIRLMNKVEKDKNLIPIMELVDILAYYVDFSIEKQPVILQETMSTIENYFALCREHGEGVEDDNTISQEFKNLTDLLRLECPTDSDTKENSSTLENKEDNEARIKCPLCGFDIGKHRLFGR